MSDFATLQLIGCTAAAMLPIPHDLIRDCSSADTEAKQIHAQKDRSAVTLTRTPCLASPRRVIPQ